MTLRGAEGVLLVDKTAGMTSHDVVAVARRALRTRRIGHAGTLDPFATGLLVLLVGRATRLLPYVDGEPKVYDATVRFGAATTTDDATGEIVARASLPAPERVAEAIGQLTGRIDQRPPAYSAKQVGGVRAHAAARRGAPLELAPTPVLVHSWELRAQRGDEIDVTITCGGGTYVRALARDLGVLVGSLGHCSALRRTRSGCFWVEDAQSLAALAEVPRLLPPRAAVPQLAVESLDDAALARVRHGNTVPASAPGERAALLDQGGEVVAIATRQGAVWQPGVVLVDG